MATAVAAAAPKFYTYAKQATAALQPGETLAFQVGKGYFAKPAATPAPAASPGTLPGLNQAALEAAANTAADQQINPQVQAIQQQQQYSDQQAQAHQEAIQGFTDAAAKILGGLAPAYGAADESGASEISSAAGAFTNQQQAQEQAAQDANRAFVNQVAPGSAPSTAPAPSAVADASYALSGAIPADQLAKEGVAAATYGLDQPGITLATGAQNLLAAIANNSQTDQQFAQQIATIQATRPALFQSILSTLTDTQIKELGLENTLQNTAFNQKAKIVSLNQAAQKISDTEATNKFNENYKTATYKLSAAKFAQTTLNQNRNYQLALGRLGISQKNLQLKIAADAFTQANGGFTQKQVAAFNTKLDALLGAGKPTHTVNGTMPQPVPLDKAGNPIKINPKTGLPISKPVTWLNTNTYANFLEAALKKGVPIQLAIQKANSVWPETERGNLGPLQHIVQVAQEAQQQAHDYKLTTGQILGTSPKNGADITYSVPASLSTKGKQAVNGIMQLAQEYLGTPYAWGGESPSGFDCSGLAQYLYAKMGISIPRTTYEQSQGGISVPKNQLQAGDLVFYKGSDPETQGGKLLPGHVGIYIGQGKIVEAPQTGSVVQVVNLNSIPDYMGAKRYVK